MPNGKEVVARASSRSGYYFYANPTLIYALPIYEVVATGQIYAAGRPSTTDFYQLGASHITKLVSFSADAFFIDRSNEQVYIADDGSLEFAGRSRAYGFEAKTSLQLTRHLAFNGGFTQPG